MGGGSDLPAFYEKHPGKVLSCAIDKHIFISLHPRFDSSETVIRYSQVETVNNLDDIEHSIVKTVLKKYDLTGIEITCTGDIPAKTGLGSSSSFTVGLLNAVHTYLGSKKLKAELAEEASSIEMELSNGVIGKQDQYAAAYGGLNEFVFNPDGSVNVKPISLDKKSDQLLESMSLFFTGLTRNAETILQKHSDGLKNNQDSSSYQTMLTEMVPAVEESLVAGNVRAFGDLLNRGWELKRMIAQGISTEHVDSIYAEMLNLGCYGGKLLGAGGGGFILGLCSKDVHKKITQSLKLKSMPFSIDYDGTQIIHDDGERINYDSN